MMQANPQIAIHLMGCQSLEAKEARDRDRSSLSPRVEVTVDSVRGFGRLVMGRAPTHPN
jgi:hypothetical protein